jgi:hypothetical protein
VASFDEVIPPGQVGYVKVKLDTQKITGKTNKQIAIFSNDPKSLETSVLLRAEVVGSALLIPFDRLKLTNVGQRQDRRRRLLIRKDPTETGELRVTDLKASVDWVAPSLLKIETEMSTFPGFPPGKPGDYLLEIDFVNQPPHGVSTAEVTFKTGLPRFPEMTVPVNVEYSAPVIMNRKEIVLPPGTTDVYRDSVLLTIRRGLDPSTLTVHSEIEPLQIALEQVGERHFKLFLTWSGEAFEAGALKASVAGYHAVLPVRIGE